MKPILVVLILSLSIFAQKASSQNKTLVLWDKENSRSVESALILNPKQAKGSTITNSNGFFELPQTWQLGDSLFVHHVNYVTTAFPLSKNLKDTLYIQQQEFVLDEVVVYAEKTVEQFLEGIIANTEAKLKFPVKYDGYYKEFTLENEKYISFADASMQFYLEKKRDNLKIDASLRESRAVDLKTSEKIDLSLVAPLGFEKALAFADPINISSFLNSENFEKYNYSIVDGDPLVLIKVSPKKPEEANYKNGKILVNKKDSTLSYVQMQTHPVSIKNMKELNLLVVKAKLKDYIVSVKYKSDEKGIRLDFVRMNMEMRSFNNKSIDQTNRFITDLTISNLAENQESIRRGDQYRKKSIAKNGTDYQTEFWKKASHVSLSSEELELIDSHHTNLKAN